jgi:hypothetical protein
VKLRDLMRGFEVRSSYKKRNGPPSEPGLYSLSLVLLLPPNSFIRLFNIKDFSSKEVCFQFATSSFCKLVSHPFLYLL